MPEEISKRLALARAPETDPAAFVPLGPREFSATFPVTLTGEGRGYVEKLAEERRAVDLAEGVALMRAACGELEVTTVEIRPGIFEHTITGRPRRRTVDELIDEVVERLADGGFVEITGERKREHSPR